MKKIKMIGLSLLALGTFALPSTLDSVQASSNESGIVVNSETLFHAAWYPETTEQAKWVKVTKNGKVYSGYIYNRGYYLKVGYDYFTGTLRTGPYEPTDLKKES